MPDEFWFQKLWAIIAPALYLVSVGTNLYAAYQYYIDGHVISGSLTLVFILLPMLIEAIKEIIIVLMQGVSYILYKSFHVEGVWKCLLVVVTICLTPFIPFIKLILGAIAINRELDDISIIKAEFTKITVAITGSLPQVAFQTFIIALTLQQNDEAAIGIWQWAAATASLFTFSFDISTNSIWFPNATSSKRAAFFFCGLLSISSRLVVCCAYCLEEPVLWLMPSGSVFVASLTVWLVKRACPCASCVPLADHHRICSKSSMLYMVFTWILTASYSNFTKSGVPASVVTFIYAIGFVEAMPGVGATVTIILAGISLFINIILTAVPYFKCIEEHWLTIDTKGKSFYY